MGGIYGRGCKEVYRFPDITYPCSSCICSFFAAASLLLVHFLNVFRSCSTIKIKAFKIIIYRYY